MNEGSRELPPGRENEKECECDAGCGRRLTEAGLLPFGFGGKGRDTRMSASQFPLPIRPPAQQLNGRCV